MTRCLQAGHLAASKVYRAEAVTALLDAGANPMTRNAAGRTPWDLMQENDALKGSAAYWRMNDAMF